MSFSRGDLLTKTRRLIKGNIIKKPLWFDAVSKIPPQSIRVRDGKAPKIELPEDRLVRSYLARHPEAQCTAFALNSFEAPVARRFAAQVLELLELGYSEAWARDAAEANLAAEEKAARRRNVQEGRPLPKSVIEEVQEDEWSYMANSLRSMEPINQGNG